MNKNPIRLKLKNKTFSSLLEKLLGLKPLIALYDRWLLKDKSTTQPVGSQFLDHTLNSLDSSVEVLYEDRLLDIPKNDSIIFVANHPFGGIEGMQMAQLLLKYRPDLKVLTNELLTLIPEFKDLFIGVDVLSENSAQKNVKGMKEVSRHLKKGGALLIFPAGTVASVELDQRKIVEKPWTPMLGRLISRYQTACVPFHIEGRNSFAFYCLGLIHKRLRTAMLARELSNKKGTCTRVIVGSLLKEKDLSQIMSQKGEQALNSFLRLSSEALGNEAGKGHLKNNESFFSEKKSLIASNDDSQLDLLTHLSTLDEFLLLSKADFSVFCVPYSKMGPIMKELAIARELTFRAVGEGIGEELDSDEFDPHYLHLFVWDRQQQQIVGAYRIGRCDEIIKAQGVKGLYSRSLFKYQESYINRIGGALEVGRSFVAQDYQRNPRALDMLWKGIGSYVAANPQYHTLFGCVSISQRHSLLARAFLSETMLSCFPAQDEFLTDIRPLKPLKVKGRLWTTETLKSLGDIAIINKLVGSFDRDKNMPVLLRHYLALNGRFVSFSVNTGFSQALDGLILVDLRNSPMRYLNRYLGRVGAKDFLEKWEKNEAAA